MQHIHIAADARATAFLIAKTAADSVPTLRGFSCRGRSIAEIKEVSTQIDTTTYDGINDVEKRKAELARLVLKIREETKPKGIKAKKIKSGVGGAGGAATAAAAAAAAAAGAGPA